MIADKIDFLGYVQADTGIMNNPVPVYQVLVKERETITHIMMKLIKIIAEY